MLPRSGNELASLLKCSSFSFFWGGKNTSHGYWKSGTYGVPVITQSGDVSFGDVVNVLGCYNSSGSIWGANSSCLIESDKSFAFVIFVRSVSDATISSAGIIQQYSGSLPLFATQPYNLSSYWLWYTNTPELTGQLACEDFSNAGTCVALLGGWDARTRKGWVVRNGIKSLTPDTVTGKWGLSNDILLAKYAYGDIEIVQFGLVVGSDAEKVADNAVSNKLILDSLLNRSRNINNSNSIVVLQRSSSSTLVSRSNSALISAEGIAIHPAIVNLMARYYSMIGWTSSEITPTDWIGFDSSGIRSLSKLAETTANDEHKTSITVTPLATGRHYFECTVRMSSIAALAIIIDNGTENVGATSFDVAGVKVDFTPEILAASITQVGSSLYRVRIPMDLASTDDLTISVWGLALSGEDWVNYYVGSASRIAYVGQWSLIRASLPPVAIPVSMGSAATAIATVTDWTNTKGINRLKNGRITADVCVVKEEWPEEDVCLWSWRKDTNNGVEVWLRYDSTDGSKIIFSLALNVVVAGTPTETILTGDDNGLILQDGTDFVSELRLSIAIDSAGLVKWFMRSESDESIVWAYIGGEETYEPVTDDSFLRGETQLSGYTAPVPTSIRFGSNLGGTGQQHMKISEVAVW